MVDFFKKLNKWVAAGIFAAAALLILIGGVLVFGDVYDYDPSGIPDLVTVLVNVALICVLVLMIYGERKQIWVILLLLVVTPTALEGCGSFISTLSQTTEAIDGDADLQTVMYLISSAIAALGGFVAAVIYLYAKLTDNSSNLLKLISGLSLFVAGLFTIIAVVFLSSVVGDSSGLVGMIILPNLSVALEMIGCGILVFKEK